MRNCFNERELHDHAIQLLFGDYSLSQQQRNAIERFIQQSLKRLQCSVLYRVDSDWVSLLEELGISQEIIGRKEAIILPMRVRFSADYRKRSPTLVAKLVV